MPVNTKKFKILRKNLGWSCRILANKAGISHGTIANIEAGKVAPLDDTIKKCADALGVPLEEITIEEEIPEIGNSRIGENTLDYLFKRLNDIEARLEWLENHQHKNRKVILESPKKG